MSTFPRENLYRASYPGCELRDSGDNPPTLVGHFAVFDQWTEINSAWEGSFLERIAPGAFAKSMRPEWRDKLRVLFQHGKDPQIGDKPIAGITELREDKTGAYYEAELFDGLDPLLMAGLRAGGYGASFRFKVMREDVDDDPGASTFNERGLPERTIKEAQVMEFGPVTFPAYSGATAGVRSLTDLVHDVDTMTAATSILLDDERLAHAKAFISRDLPVDEEPERSGYSTTAPADHDAEPSVAHLSTARSVKATSGPRWWDTDERKVPASWR